MPTLAENKNARRSFKFLDEFEAGIVLSGPEVKSAKKGSVNFQGSYVSAENGELWLKNFHISPYAPAAFRNLPPTRPRKLLLKKSEISTLLGKMKTQGLTLIPKNLYTRGGLIKVRIALAQGLKTKDKRDLIKKRDVDKRIRRALRS